MSGLSQLCFRSPSWIVHGLRRPRCLGSDLTGAPSRRTDRRRDGMKPLLVPAALCALLLAAFALPASATAVANFEGSTLGFSQNGDFDAQRGTGSSCSAGTISYSWSFDNGGTPTGNPVTHHWGGASAGTVTL